MTPTPELKSAQNLTSADYLASRVKEAYQSLGTENLSDVESLYASDIYFEDPLHAVQGRPALMQYFTKQFANLNKCAFKFHSTIVNDTDVFMTWTMFLNHPKLRGRNCPSRRCKLSAHAKRKGLLPPRLLRSWIYVV